MAELSWIGRNAASNNDLSYRDYTASNIAKNATAAQIDAAINQAYAEYANKTYVDQQDSLLADQAYIDGKDADYVLNSSKNQPNGVPALDGTGKVDRGKISTVDTQRFPRSFWSPAGYGTAASASSSEVTLYQYTVPDPGYQYKLIVHGQVETSSTVDGTWPVVNVRRDSNTGPIIAQGLGGQSATAWFGGDYFSRVTTGNLGGANYWQETTVLGDGGNPYCDGTEATWLLDPSGTPERPFTNGWRHKMIYRKLGADAVTSDDWQEVTVVLGKTIGGDPTLLGWGANNHIYGRMSADLSQYCVFRWNWTTVAFSICVGTETEVARTEAFTQATGDTLTARFGTTAGKRAFQFLKNGAAVLSYTDSNGVSGMGSYNRYWGIGVEAGYNTALLGAVRWQSTPSSYAQVLVNDMPPDTSTAWKTPALVKPTPLAAQEAKTGAATLFVTLTRSSASGTASAGTYLPNLRIEAVPA